MHPTGSPINNSGLTVAVTNSPRQAHQKVAALASSVKRDETPAPPTPIAQQPIITPGSHEDWMNQAGISPEDYGAVDYIVSHESGWCPFIWEGESRANGCPDYHGVSDYDGYGLCQSTPPQKMAAAGDDWTTNPVTQLKWCTSHAIADYGSWWGAYNHWIANHNW